MSTGNAVSMTIVLYCIPYKNIWNVWSNHKQFVNILYFYYIKQVGFSWGDIEFIDMSFRKYSIKKKTPINDPLTSQFVNAVKIGLRHPDPVVETSSLSSVNPPDVWYRLSIPEETIDRGCLSALQLEAITYAAQVNIYSCNSILMKQKLVQTLSLKLWSTPWAVSLANHKFYRDKTCPIFSPPPQKYRNDQAHSVFTGQSN